MAKDMKFNIDFMDKKEDSPEEQLDKINKIAEEFENRIIDKSYLAKKKLGFETPSLEFDEINGLLSRNIEDKKRELEEDLNRQYQNALNDINIYNEEPNKIQTKKTEEPKKTCLKQSIKPNVKVPYTPKKHRVNKTEIFLGVAIFASAAGLTFAGINELKNYTEDNKIVKEKITDYKYNVYDENTTEQLVNLNVERTNEYGDTYMKEEITPVHQHNIPKMIEKTREKYEDPVLAFYLLYNNLDSTCLINQTEFNNFLIEFNNAYGTTYKDFNDFMIQNNFQNKKELREYIVNVIKEQKERLGR